MQLFYSYSTFKWMLSANTFPPLTLQRRHNTLLYFHQPTGHPGLCGFRPLSLVGFLGITPQRDISLPVIGRGQHQHGLPLSSPT